MDSYRHYRSFTFPNPILGTSRRTCKLRYRCHETKDSETWRRRVENAFQWLKENTQDAVVGTIWEDGIQLNVFSGAKNIIDTDHYLQHWVHLYCRHVFCAQSEAEALSFLKTHNATHLLFRSWDVTFRVSDLSFIGSNVQNDRQFRYHDFEQSDNPTKENERLTLQETSLAFVDISAPTSEKRKITAQFRDNTTVHQEIDLQPEAA